ncbi:MAG: ketopantoate reductase family protein [Vicinamibacterales bacterium]
MRIAIVGAGAVGGYFAARLARAGEDVAVVARGAHLDAIRTHGFQVVSPALGDFTARCRAESAPARIGVVDLVVLAVKTYDNATAIGQLAPLVGPDTAILTLQNGIDSAAELAAVYGESRVLGGTTYVATAVAAPGRIVQTGVHRSILFGEAFGPRLAISPRVDAIAAVLAPADIEVTPVADARVPIWDKFVYLAPFSGFTGAARLPIGPLWRQAPFRDQFHAAAREVATVAAAEGIAISADRFETLARYMGGIPDSTRSSLLIDLEQGKRIEVEALQGAAVRRAAVHGISVPILSTLYAVLKPWATGSAAPPAAGG